MSWVVICEDDRIHEFIDDTDEPQREFASRDEAEEQLLTTEMGVFPSDCGPHHIEELTLGIPLVFWAVVCGKVRDQDFHRDETGEPYVSTTEMVDLEDDLLSLDSKGCGPHRIVKFQEVR